MRRPPHPCPALRALLAAAMLLAAARAGLAAPGPDPACAPGPADAPASGASVDDRLDVTLADGRRLRLAGLDPARATATSPGLAADARRALESWLAAGGVTLRPLSPAPDRWGRLPALLFRAGAEPASAAAALLRLGLGRAAPDRAIHGCWSALLGAEDAARQARLGLWADPEGAVLDAGDAAGLARQAGGLALVEGILHVHEARGTAGPGTLYLTLGRDRWGFSAALSRRDAGRFAGAGLDVRDYEGTPVRLRGDLDARFGPRMRLTDPDQLESLEPGSAPDPAPAAARDTGR